MRTLNLSLILIAVFLSACSTVNRGTIDYFRIDTVPQGATVTTSVIQKSNKKRQLEYVGCHPTPCAIALPRRSEFVVKLEHPGYEPTELFIRSTSMKGGTTANAAANLATASGSGLAVGGIFVAPLTAFSNLFSLSSPAVNTSGIASSGAAAGLGIGVGMIAIDMATGANLNLFPNPVIIELAPEGSDVRTDPLVGLYKNMTKAKTLSDVICAKRNKDRVAGEPTCKEARADYQDKREIYQMLKRQQLDDLKVAIKKAKAEQKAAAPQ